MKKCSQCKETKSPEEFRKASKEKDGLQHACRVCANRSTKLWRHKNRETELQRAKERRANDPEKRHNKHTKKWRDANPDKVKDLHLRKKYKIDLDNYQAMSSAQGGKCLICSTHRDDLKMDLAVDHCHKTGKVRGLLCVRCNRAIGLLEDNPELLDKAASHLRTHQ